MRIQGLWALVGAFILLAAAPAQALQCVPYARQHSGVHLRGDAWTWWHSAAGSYDRGQAPQLGAVMVFKKHGHMRYGHVAVVHKMISERKVLIDHANWAPRRSRGRGKVTTMVTMVDVSPLNDWSQVRVWNSGSNDLGSRIYPTYGFIYPTTGSGQTAVAAGLSLAETVEAAEQRQTFLAADRSLREQVMFAVPSAPLQEIRADVRAELPPVKAEKTDISQSAAELLRQPDTAKPDLVLVEPLKPGLLKTELAHASRPATVTASKAEVTAPAVQSASPRPGTPLPVKPAVSAAADASDADSLAARRVGAGRY